ncbi:MAG: gamma-glutamyltransferase family protein [Hyphomicrobiales bacterium]
MSFAPAPSHRPTLHGSRHMVSAGHPLASMAGLQILEAGGSAVDAGVAAGFALNVVQPDMANLGGVAPIMIFQARTRTVSTIAGVGRWPRTATLARVREAGHGRIPASPARWIVPSAVASWLLALSRFGTMNLAEVLAPALRLAEEGFAANYWLIHNLREAGALFGPGTENGAIFCPQGRLPRPGEPVRQPALGQTLRILIDAEARHGGKRQDAIEAARDAFYRGEIAERIGRFAEEVGSFLRADDLHEFSVLEEPPLFVDYRGHRVHACGPWCQGPALLQMLAVIGKVDIAAEPRLEAEHLLIEAVKLALADRNSHYGDPGFNAVPMRRLLSDTHAAELMGRIDRRRSGNPGEPALQEGGISPDTTYACVVDGEGNAFSATPSDSTILSTPMVPGLGFGISDRGLQASLDPGDPNAVGPGRRPRLTPNPALVLGDGFVMPFGTPGAEVQTQVMLQFLVNALDRGMELQSAIEAPRWASYAIPATEDPHASEPHALKVEGRMDADLRRGLAAKGHDIRLWPDFAPLAGAVCAVRRETRSGLLSAGADPRRLSYAVGL